MAEDSLTTSKPVCKRGKVYVREQHGMTQTPTYKIWAAVLRRCRNPNSKDYGRYGGRGITVCERWGNSFLAFYEDMGEQPPGMQIDRIDNSRGYEPGNCRWVTSRQNNRNRRDSVYVEFRGERLHIRELAERVGIAAGTLAWRIRHGMSLEEAAIAPLTDHNSYVVYRGERMSMVELEQRCGIDRETIRARMERQDMSLEQAAETPLKREPVFLNFRGQQIRLFELSKLAGMSVNTLKYRIFKCGMTPEEAISKSTGR